jgi:hypothetical protein
MRAAPQLLVSLSLISQALSVGVCERTHSLLVYVHACVCAENLMPLQTRCVKSPGI